MNLGFMTHHPRHMGKLAGQPTYFINKIWAGLNLHCRDAVDKTFVNYYERNPSAFSNMMDVHPKIHSIRPDEKDRWKIGSKIHFIINNRRPERFQFAPVLEVKSIQRIDIAPSARVSSLYEGKLKHHIGAVFIDGVILPRHKVEKLAINDGFDSIEDFFKWFDKDLTDGKLIHWTDLKY